MWASAERITDVEKIELLEVIDIVCVKSWDAVLSQNGRQVGVGDEVRANRNGFGDLTVNFQVAVAFRDETNMG